MLSVQETETTILGCVPVLEVANDTELVDLEAVTGRVLSQTVVSGLDFPHWDNSAMDGYAVRYADVQTACPDRPVCLTQIAEIPAGIVPSATIARGQTARIFTGAMLPTGADTIVMQENAQVREVEGRTIVEILHAPKEPGDFVRFKGSFYQSGSPLLPAGTRISAAEVAVLAAAQCNKIRVYRRPRVAVLSTGHELIAPHEPLKPGQIVDSNQAAISSFLRQLGMNVLPFGIVEDNPQVLAAAIAEAVSEADVVISTGGVSVGDYDFVEAVLEKLGGQIQVRSVAMKPGKPLTVATFREQKTLYFGLPGNPVSALVSCWRFVKPALLKLSGLGQGWEPLFVRATSRMTLKAGGDRESYLWGTLYLTESGFEFDRDRGLSSSGNAIGLALSNGLAVVPVGQTTIAAGDPVSVLKIAEPIVL